MARRGVGNTSRPSRSQYQKKFRARRTEDSGGGFCLPVLVALGIATILLL